MERVMGQNALELGEGRLVVLEHFAFRWVQHQLVEVIDLTTGERRSLAAGRGLAPQEACVNAADRRVSRRRFGNRPALRLVRPAREAMPSRDVLANRDVLPNRQPRPADARLPWRPVPG